MTSGKTSLDPSEKSLLSRDWGEGVQGEQLHAIGIKQAEVLKGATCIPQKKTSQGVICYLSSRQHYLCQKKDGLRYSSSRDTFFPLKERNVGAFLLDAEKTQWRA